MTDRLQAMIALVSAPFPALLLGLLIGALIVTAYYRK